MRFHVIPFVVVQIAHRDQRNAFLNTVSGTFFNGKIVIFNGFRAVFFVQKNIAQRGINLVQIIFVVAVSSHSFQLAFNACRVF